MATIKHDAQREPDIHVWEAGFNLGLVAFSSMGELDMCARGLNVKCRGGLKDVGFKEHYAMLVGVDNTGDSEWVKWASWYLCLPVIRREGGRGGLVSQRITDSGGPGFCHRESRRRYGSGHEANLNANYSA